MLRALNFPCMKRDLDTCQSRLQWRYILGISLSFCELLEDLVLHDEPDVGFLVPFSDLSFLLEVNIPTFLPKRQRVRPKKLLSEPFTCLEPSGDVRSKPKIAFAGQHLDSRLR